MQVLLKVNDEDKRDNLKHFIHQARVNRDKVVQLILSMKRRGHRAYVHLDEEAIHRRAQKLPADGIRPELITLLPNDNAYDKLRMQKAATPVEGVKSKADADACAREERPLAVVMERSSVDEGDTQIRQSSALQALVTKLDGENKIASTKGDKSQEAQTTAITRVLILQSILHFNFVHKIGCSHRSHMACAQRPSCKTNRNII